MLYDLRIDPGETRDVAAEQPDVTAELHALLGAHLASLDHGSARMPRSPELIQMLHERGYW